MLGPIFSIEMLTSARRTRYFVIRVLYALALFFALWTTYTTTQAFQALTLRQSANIAGNFFSAFAFMQLWAVLLVSPALVAGTIAVERERRTIEYLFATDLTNREIVFGKLIARLMSIGYLVLAGLPILASAMLMGGIAPEQLVAIFVITLSTMVTVAILAVAVSVWAPRVRDAITRAYIILLALLTVPWVVYMLGSVSGYYHWVEPVNQRLIAANPISAWTQASLLHRFVTHGTGNISWTPIWEMLVVQGVFSACLAILATWGVRRVHLREAGKAPPRPKRQLLVRKSRPIGDNPMLWKEMVTARASGKLGFVARIAMLLILLSILVSYGYTFFMLDGRGSAESTTTACDFLACMALLLAAGRAAGTISAEKEKDTWITLLSTPLSNREIIMAKIAGSLYAVRGLGVVIGILLIFQSIRMPEYGLAAVFLLATLAIVGFFAGALGVNYSLRCLNSTRAMGATLATALFAGGGYLFCCAPLASRQAEIVTIAPCVPFLLAYPGMSVGQWERGWRKFEMLTPYLLGCAGYAFAGFCLYRAMVLGFGRLNGRVSGPREKTGAAIER
jgi:ABC-type transport system involved in multi-copper enzyme maturation permease subunit